MFDRYPVCSFDPPAEVPGNYVVPQHHAEPLDERTHDSPEQRHLVCGP